MKCKKLLLSFALFLFVVSANAQQIVQSDYNGFTGERNIETSIVSLKSGFTNGFGIAIRAYSKNIYLSFIGYGKRDRAVGEEDRLQFLLKDGSIIKFDSRVQLPSNESSVPNLYIHHYYISKSEIEALQKSLVSIVRVVSANSYTDIAIAKKHAKELVTLCRLFKQEMNKY